MPVTVVFLWSCIRFDGEVCGSSSSPLQMTIRGLQWLCHFGVYSNSAEPIDLPGYPTYPLRECGSACSCESLDVTTKLSEPPALIMHQTINNRFQGKQPCQPHLLLSSKDAASNASRTIDDKEWILERSVKAR